MVTQRSVPPTGLPVLPNSWMRLTDAGVRERGADYFVHGKVRAAASPAGAGVHAFWVQGTHTYHVDIDAGDPLQSQCNCPHAQEVPVCKHMVAAWMAWQASRDGCAPSVTADTTATPATPPMPPGLLEAATIAAHHARARKTTASPRAPSVKGKAAAQRDAMQADLDFLQTQSAADLCAWIASQCDRDPQLSLQLGLWRRQQQNQPQTPAQWRRFLTQAMPQRRDLYGRELQRWADDAMAALQPLEAQLDTQPASIRTACTLALQRLFKLWETADDSQGQLHDLYGWLQDLLVRSVQAEPPPASWLKDWLALMQADPVGHWNEPQLLSSAGAPLRQAYSRHAIAAWETWELEHPATAARPKKAAHHRYGGVRYDDAQWNQSYQRSQLRRRYLWAMEHSLDTPGLIALMQQTARSESDWLDNVAFCERHQHHREALACAQQGLQVDPMHFGLQTALLACYQRDGWDDEAFALAQQRLAQRPQDMAALEAVLQCAAALGRSREATLAALVEQALAPAAHRPRRGTAPATLDVSAPIAWLLRAGQNQQALQLLERPHSFCERRVLHALALGQPPAQHPRAVQLLQSMLERDMQNASSPYHPELQLVRHTLARMPDAAGTVWLMGLRAQYGRKSNFLKGLDLLQR